MQRWIALGVVATVLFACGAYFARKAYCQNQPHPVWVPMPINQDLEVAKRDEIIKHLYRKLTEKDFLLQVSKDLGLPRKMNLASDADCAGELGKRVFVREGEADSPAGKVPAIHIGVKGKEKEIALSGEIAMRLMESVWKIIGIKPPMKKDA